MKPQNRFILAGLLLLIGLFAWPTRATVIVWTNTSGGAWTTAANWNPNSVPANPEDTAVITNAGTYTVTLDTSLSIAGVTLGAASGGGIRTLSWSGGTISDCSLTILSRGKLTFTGSADKNLMRCTVNNAGTITWTGTGQFAGVANGHGQSVLITNQTGGVFDIQTDATLGGSNPWGDLVYRLHNAGTFRKSSSTGTNSIDSSLGFINAGTVEVQQGALQFPNGFNSSGSFNLSANTAILLKSGNFSFSPGGIKTGAGALLVDSGSVTINGTIPSLSWTGGAIVDSVFTVATNATLSLSGSANKNLTTSTINNAGTITWAGSGYFVAAASSRGQSVLITNLAGGLFDIQNDSTFDCYNGWDDLLLRFHNAGTLRKSAGSGTTTFPTACNLINKGTVLIQQGTLVFPGFQNDGTLELLSATVASFPLGFVNNGTFSLALNSQATSIGGTVSFGPLGQLTGSGKWVIPSGTVTLLGTIPSLTWSGGQLVDSDFEVATGAVMSVTGSTDKTLLRSKLNNAGTITWTGTGQLAGVANGYGQSVLITNLAGALFDIQTDALFGGSNPMGDLAYRFHNAGTVRKSSSTGTNSIDANLGFINAGVVELQQGALKFPNGFNSSGSFSLSANTAILLKSGNFSFSPGGIKTGAGALLVDSGSVTINGTIPSLNWSGGSLVSSVFTVATNATLSLTGSADKSLTMSTINNAGNITWSGSGQLVAVASGPGQSVLITNLAGAVFDIQNDSTFGCSNGWEDLLLRFHNDGTLRKSAGNGTTTFPTACKLINTGSIVIQQGTLVFPAFQNEGTLEVLAAGATSFPLGFVNNGTFSLAADSQAILTGGAASFGSIGQLTGSGTWVIPSGTVTLTGTIPNLTWSGGQLVDSDFKVASGAVLAITGSADKTLLRSKLNNAGTVTWTGTGQLSGVANSPGQSVLITNLAGALFDIQTDANFGSSNPWEDLAYRFHNAGTLRKSAGTGTNSFDRYLSFINAGTVEMQQGALKFPNGFNSSGSFNLSANTAVLLKGGTFTFGDGSFKSGAGALLVDSGSVTINGTMPSLSWTGGSLVSSVFTVAANATLSLSGSADKALTMSTINNAGNIIWTGSGQLLAVASGPGQSVLITNLTGGLFDIQNDSTFGCSDGWENLLLRFHNAGTLRKSSGNGTTTFPRQCRFANANAVELQTGTLQLNGDFNQTSTSALALQNLNPVTPQLRLTVTGAAALDGTLTVSLLPNLAAIGQNFSVMTYGTRTGSFVAKNGLILNGGLWLCPVLSDQSLGFSVEGPPFFGTSLLTSGGFQLSWQGKPGATYRLDISTNLVDWVPLFTTNTIDGSFVFVEPDCKAAPRRFYRIAIQ